MVSGLNDKRADGIVSSTGLPPPECGEWTWESCVRFTNKNIALKPQFPTAQPGFELRTNMTTNFAIDVYGRAVQRKARTRAERGLGKENTQISTRHELKGERINEVKMGYVLDLGVKELRVHSRRDMADECYERAVNSLPLQRAFGSMNKESLGILLGATPGMVRTTASTGLLKRDAPPLSKRSKHPRNYASGESNSTRKRRTRLSASVEASLVKNDSVEMDMASREKYVLDLQNAKCRNNCTRKWRRRL
ncbi:hypothetical protein ARMGADRAFT_1060345 [Armillaria gallica]|uniref:Uncharacterized protein n=1 Tax=Armillaria gallica TaxID=47427 RepID=A0A2H3DXU6_ARMGA|nr:hypothetical protein ARMGADRAFT_1060345 [Armillaria gallica]